MNNDLISRSKLSQEIASLKIQLAKKNLFCNEAKASVLRIVDEQPTIDPDSLRPHGKNISEKHPVDEFICSACGVILQDWVRAEIDEHDNDESCCEYELRFCPRCGAKMDLEVHDGN